MYRQYNNITSKEQGSKRARKRDAICAAIKANGCISHENGSQENKLHKYVKKSKERVR